MVETIFFILLQNFCAHSLQSCLTLCDRMDCSPPCSSVHGFSKQEYWSGLPFSSPGDLPNPGIETASLMSSAFAGKFFTTSITWETQVAKFLPLLKILINVSSSKENYSESYRFLWGIWKFNYDFTLLNYLMHIHTASIF